MTRIPSIYLLLFLAALSWAALLLFTRFIPPGSPVAFCLFFLIFGIALNSTLAPLTYSIEQRVFPKRHYYLLMGYALRQSSLLTIAVILNLVFLALHSWNIIVALIILVAAVILEILFLARK
jgi:hypothetical protein